MTKRHWPVIRVSDLVSSGEAEIKTGPFGTQLKASSYVDHGTPVINVRNIGFGVIRQDKLEFIADDTVARLSGHLLRRGDIVFGRKGAVERHVLIRDAQNRWFQGSDCLRLRLQSQRVLPQFLSYYLLTREHQQWMMQQCSHGATMASLNQDIVGRIEFRCPDPQAQRRIASVLSAYDDLIENNTRRIAILEEMARRIYNEWFVRFRFPGHENVRMVESEMGAIPEGWEHLPLGSFVEHHIGGGWGQEEPSEGFPIPAYVIRGTDIPDVRFSSLGRAPLRYHTVANFRSRKLCARDIVFEVSGGSKDQPVGRAVMVGERLLAQLSEPVICASFCRLVRANASLLLPELLRFHFEHIYANREIMQYQTQSTGITNFKFKVFLEKEMIIKPATAVQERFAAAIRPMLDLVEALGIKNVNLRDTRDLFLPKLISGELDLSAMPEPEAIAA